MRYAHYCQSGTSVLALHTQRTLCRQPLAGAVLSLLDLLDTPGGASLIDPECRAAIEAHPEIRSWP